MRWRLSLALALRGGSGSVAVHRWHFRNNYSLHFIFVLLETFKLKWLTVEDREEDLLCLSPAVLHHFSSSGASLPADTGAGVTAAQENKLILSCVSDLKLSSCEMTHSRIQVQRRDSGDTTASKWSTNTGGSSLLANNSLCEMNLK